MVILDFKKEMNFVMGFEKQMTFHGSEGMAFQAQWCEMEKAEHIKQEYDKEIKMI